MRNQTESLSRVDEAVITVADHLFRRESARLVSILTRIFGVHRLQMAEDVVQEAMIRALRTWPYYGIPKDPSAWLMQTAKHAALDILRREKRFIEKQPELLAHIEQRLPNSDISGELLEDEIKDNRLRLMFVCCHPVLPLEMQTALALKILGGFSPGEIAAAFLTTEAAIAKRLTRARHRLQTKAIRFEIPSGSELLSRLEGVLNTLYLLFNEGYKASTGERVVKEELCAEAIRLTEILAEHPAGDQPRVHALLSLMLFNAARLPSRTDVEGNILRLEEQDRTLWNRGMIQRGVRHLARSAVGEGLSEFHLQAGIAACHCLAPGDASTDWPKILSLYDHLAEIDDSPVIALNRAVAIAKVHGPAHGIAEVQRILDASALASYYLTHAILGDLERQRDHYSAAAAHFENALRLTGVKSEQSFLIQRLRECHAG
jgi:RNA polymerase sigma factor (sigma-70 family)